jgi:pimeloyl-ACP methyl ester carboxylesterase
MAARARLIATADAASECARVVVPTLIVTGEPALDRIVSVSGSDGVGGTLGYARLIPGARVVQLDRTGHLGSITRPREFAAAIGRFLADVRDRHAA